MAHEKKLELILKIDMYDSTSGWNGDRRGHFEAEVYAYKPSAQYDAIPTDYLAGYESLWAHFAMDAQYGAPDVNDGQAYGFEYGYKPQYGLVKQPTAERYAKGYAKVARAYTKLCEQYGQPSSLGQEVVYVMQALGVKQAVWRLPVGRAGGQYREWRVSTSMPEIQRYIDGTVAEFREKYCTSQASQAA